MGAACADQPRRRLDDPAEAGQILSTAYFSTVLRWIDSEPPPFSLTAQLDKMLDIILRGLLV